MNLTYSTSNKLIMRHITRLHRSAPERALRDRLAVALWEASRLRRELAKERRAVDELTSYIIAKEGLEI